MYKSKEIDLYDWTQYALFRSLLKKPIPSPRVWDNAGSLGFWGGNYKKEKFFDQGIFTDYITTITKNNFGGEIRVKRELGVYGSILKADRSDHTFYSGQDSHCYLNFDKFLTSQNISLNFDYQELYDSIREIYYLVRIQHPGIDSGFIAPLYSEKFKEYPTPDELNWINLNRKIGEELNQKNIIEIEFIYKNISSIYGFPIEKLYEISHKLNYDLWFVDMFNYSFRPRYLKNINSAFAAELREYQNLKKPEIIEDIYTENSSKKSLEKTNQKEIVKSPNYKEGDFEIIKNGSIEIVKSESQNTIKNKESLNNLSKDNNPKNLRFIPSEAKIPIGFKSLGDEIKDLKFALQNPSISFRSFFNDCEYIKDGNWIEETLFCQAFDEELYCRLIKEYHRYSIAELNSMKVEELKKAERKGAGIGSLFGLLAGGIMAPITAAMGANVGKMISNNIDERKPLKDFLPDPGLVFLKDQGSYISLSKTYKGSTTKRRICFKKNSLNNENIYFDLIPMIVFDNWVTPAQIFKLENSYYLRSISANYDLNNEFNLQYNPVKYRRSYSYSPRADIEKLSNSNIKTRIVGETIEKTPTIFYAWLRDDESFQHFYFDYATDGTIF